jgi:acetyl esterase/lipase
MLRRIGCVLTVAVLAFAALAFASCGTIRAGMMVRDAFRPAAELAPQVEETRIVVRAAGQDVPVRIYRPKGEDGPRPAVVLIHGAVTGGAGDSRLVALARAMAIRGGTVATPDLVSLRRFRLDPLDPARVAAVGRALAGRRDIVEDGRVALVGISVGGSYGLLAALDPRLEGRVSTILTFGAYADLDRLLRRWMIDPTPDAPDLLDPQTYGRRLVLRGNLEILVPAAETAAVGRVIDGLLGHRPRVDAPEGLSPAGRRVVDVATSEGPVDPEVVGELLRPLVPDVASLSPVRRARVPRAPVYLLHGEGDPVVPVADLAELADFLRPRGVDLRTHRTDLFTHVGRAADETPSLFEAWPMLSFIADAMADAGF